MSQRGKVSIAHEYGPSGACIHCMTYKVNVARFSLNCTVAREKLADAGKLNPVEPAKKVVPPKAKVN